jgi:LacI family transcriptional regulator
MSDHSKDHGARRSGPTRSVTIKDLAAELGLSITTISRALNGYSDVGEKTRKRVAEAAREIGYRPNRNAQRLVTRRTHNIAWVQPDNDRKFVDPHFVEVMAGVLRGARAGNYDIVLSGDTPDRELAVYDRYVNDNSVDGFIVDLPREGDPRITYLLEAGRPFVVHGRDGRSNRYGWVDIDNYGNFYRLTRLMLANGHRHLAFVNGDEHFNYAVHRRQGVLDALADAGLGADHVTILNSVHPMGDAGFKLTATALDDPRTTAILYSSTLMAVEGNAAVPAIESTRQVEIATMDDELYYLDLTRFAGRFSYVRSSLREAGAALVGELLRQCEDGSAPAGHVIPSTWHIRPQLSAETLKDPLPSHRQQTPF